MALSFRSKPWARVLVENQDRIKQVSNLPVIRFCAPRTMRVKPVFLLSTQVQTQATYAELVVFRLLVSIITTKDAIQVTAPAFVV